uniref:Uncharacterized protein n=2 Tax=Loa loa TaxID=7209 RepID=A0A1I7VF07_LOALO
MCNKDLTIRCGLNTLQFNSTQLSLTPTQLNLLQPKTTHAIQPDPNSTQPNTTQHIQFKAAQRILGSRSTTLVIFGYWSTSHSTIQKRKIHHRMLANSENPEIASLLGFLKREPVMLQTFQRFVSETIEFETLLMTRLEEAERRLEEFEGRNAPEEMKEGSALEEPRTRMIKISVPATHTALDTVIPEAFHPEDLGDLPEQLRRELELPEAES